MRRKEWLLPAALILGMVFSGCYDFVNVTDRGGEDYQGWTVYADPADMELLSPADNTAVLIYRDSCDLICSEILNADSYSFQIARDEAFADVVIAGLSVEHTYTFDPSSSSFADGTTYYWRAKAGSGDYVVTPLSFTVKEPSVGDTMEGGIVFYLDGQGGGLVAAEGDQSGSFGTIWGPIDYEIGCNDWSIGTGSSNTQSIVISIGENGGTSYAAQLCSDLSLNGYSDWFLPSKNELSQMETSLHNFALGNFSTSYYWSSTEASDSRAYVIYFGYIENESDMLAKSKKCKVRAVRAFNYTIESEE